MSHGNCKTKLREANKPSLLPQPSPHLKALETPSLLLNWQRRNRTPPPDSRFPVFAPLNSPHQPLLRSLSSKPRPVFRGHLPHYTFLQPRGSATGPQSKQSPNAYNL